MRLFFETFFSQQFVDSVNRLKQTADGFVVVQSIDEVSDVFGHINFLIPWTVDQFLWTVVQVGGEDFGNVTSFVSFVEVLQTIAEQTEGGADEDSVCTGSFQFFTDIQNGVTGGDHIVNNDQIFACYVRTQEVMSNDWVTAVYDYGVVSAFVEHTQVNTENGGVVHAAPHTAFVRGDDHQFAQVEIRNIVNQSFYELIGRLNAFKTAAQRNCVLYTSVMSVKGDDVFNTHVYQFLESQCAVQRFTGGAFVLTAFVQHRHNNVDTTSFTTDCSDDTFDVLEVVIWAHWNFHAVHIVGHTVVEYIAYDENIMATSGFQNGTFCFTGAETWAFGFQQVGITDVAVKISVFGQFAVASCTPFSKVSVYFAAHIFAASHAYYAEHTDWDMNM